MKVTALTFVSKGLSYSHRCGFVLRFYNILELYFLRIHCCFHDINDTNGNLILTKRLADVSKQVCQQRLYRPCQRCEMLYTTAFRHTGAGRFVPTHRRHILTLLTIVDSPTVMLTLLKRPLISKAVDVVQSDCTTARAKRDASVSSTAFQVNTIATGCQSFDGESGVYSKPGTRNQASLYLARRGVNHFIISTIHGSHLCHLNFKRSDESISTVANVNSSSYPVFMGDGSFT